MNLIPEGQPLTLEMIRDLPWRVSDPERWQEFQKSADRVLVRDTQFVPIKPKALRGGGILQIPENTLPDDEITGFLSGERRIGVYIVDTNEEPEKLFYYPAKDCPPHFSANLTHYRSRLARMVENYWDKARGQSPIPQARTIFHPDDGLSLIVTDYREGFKDLGSEDPKTAIHELDLRELPISEIPRLFEVLDVIHVPSDIFLEWDSKTQGSQFAPSWLKKGNPKCALRGQEWWKDGSANMDRFRELLGKTYVNKQIADLYNEFFPEGNFSQLLEKMLDNNMALYPHQDGRIDGKNLVGNLVVTHGTLYPGQIHKKLDSKTGNVEYMITGGDRAQLYGLRGQMIDWLVSSAAASPEHQRTFIKAFIEKYPDLKERRGLAMHVMYRSISELPWFTAHGKMTEARNLIKLTRDILTGNGNDWNGAWDGVNTSM